MIAPRLEMNRNFFAVQRIALKQAHIAMRPQLLGRVLVMIRFNPIPFFKFLSETVDVFLAAALGGSSSNAPAPRRTN